MKIRYDDNLESYQGFFDTEWIKKLSKKVINTFLDPLVFELSASWKGASNARYLPWLMVENMKSILVGFSQIRKPFPLEVVDKLIERLANNLEKHKTTLIYHDKKALINEIKTIQEEMLKINNDFSNKIDKNNIWKELIKIPDFAISLWMSEVNAYSAVYFAYEIFLINCLKQKLGLTSLRTTSNKFIYNLNNLMGEDITKDCWTDKFVEKARLIRHALVHNGRKITNDLQKYRSELLVEDNEIVIFPHDTNNLFNELKIRVNKFCARMLSIY